MIRTQGLVRFLGIAAIGCLLSMPALAQDKGHDKGDKGKHGQHDGDKGHKDDSGVGNGAEVGKAAPDFTLKGTDGKTYKLSDYKDKIVVLEWINRECPVCQAQQSKLKQSAETLQKKGVVWLAIDSSHTHGTTDNAEHVKKAGLTYPILDDSAGTVGKAYGAKSTPTMFVINKGTVAYSGSLIPQKADSPNHVTTAVDELLAGKPVTTSSTKAYGCSVKYKQ